MTTAKKSIVAGIVVLVLGGMVYANIAFKRTTGVEVTAEKIERRDLEAIVTASGKIQPKKIVQISAETPGKVVNLAVKEGDLVTAGQPLLQIDPRNIETQVANREASLATARSTLEGTRVAVENAKVALKQAQDDFKRQEGLWKGGLTTRDAYDRSMNQVRTMETNLKSAEQSVKTQEERIKAEQANVDSSRYDLTKLRIVSPISGLVTRRNIEEGETAMIGTMNNAGTVLLTIADLSVIQAEVEVDETDIPFVKLGQPAKVTIDALPDQTFTGKVTEVGNSPIQATGAGAASTRATNFKVVVTVDGVVPNVRPGFTCTSTITTATRDKVLSVPIQATTVREVVLDAKGQMVRAPKPEKGKMAPKSATMTTELKPGETRKELEGVFLIKDSQVEFVPVKTGIVGEKYFELLSGLKEGDQVITGPFASVRTLKDYDPVKITTPTTGATK